MADREVQVFRKVGFIKIFGLICNLEQDSCCLERNTGLLLLLHPDGLCFGECSDLLDWVNVSHFTTAWLLHLPHVWDPEGVRGL